MTPEKREYYAILSHIIPASAAGGALQDLSSFIAALRDARCDTNRNQNTGIPNSGEGQDHWLGNAGYAMLLDQIGVTLEPKSERAAPCGERRTRDQWTGFERALWDFGPADLTWGEVQALYALRSSIFHHYAVVYVHKTNPLRIHCFELTGDIRKPFIEIPNPIWDGDLTRPIPDSSKTKINMAKFGDMVEALRDRVERMARDDQLRIFTGMKGGLNEFKNRYGIRISRY